ncbi:hypothetical protein B0T19DRAFT_416720 [Cercophora scortea]|uniref:Uncharacterized protein n=1 Tax=Cercophora scortea TaxID=314031 RepID=A0AAE0MIH5_9PEZI|nr:hypothetical protein B0T19DRAFT_416720 [Cercophora scortea]
MKFEPSILLCLVLPSLATTLEAAHSQQCYGPQKETGQAWGLPCDPDQAVTVCCDADDFCLSNGLCLTGGSNSSGTFKYHGCTDPDWPWPCRRYCDDASSDNTELVLCEGDRYCCGKDLSCCSGKSGTFSIPVFTDVRRPGASTALLAPSSEITSTMTQVIQVTPTTSTQTLEVTRNAVESAVPTPTPTLVDSSPGSTEAPVETTRGGLTRDQQIAIGIGISLGVPSMIATVWLCCLRVFRGH